MKIKNNDLFSLAVNVNAFGLALLSRFAFVGSVDDIST
jgi:hypothetical protein